MSEVDDVAIRICEILAQERGHTAVAQPGRLISALASEVFGVEVRASANDRNYLITALAIRHLESMGMVRVLREGEEHPERGNRLYALVLTIE